MSVVVDANLLVVLVNGDPRGEVAAQRFQDWINQAVDIHTPDLALYEIANSFTRLVRANLFPGEQVAEAWVFLARLPITYNRLTMENRIVEIALSLSRQSAYDAAYLALAESLNAELWTLDGSLYRNAVGQGFPVRLLSE